jgi:hypothetical protein
MFSVPCDCRKVYIWQRAEPSRADIWNVWDIHSGSKHLHADKVMGHIDLPTEGSVYWYQVLSQLVLVSNIKHTEILQSGDKTKSGKLKTVLIPIVLVLALVAPYVLIYRLGSLGPQLHQILIMSTYVATKMFVISKQLTGWWHERNYLTIVSSELTSML